MERKEGRREGGKEGRKEGRSMLHVPPTILMLRVWAVNVQTIQVLCQRKAQLVDPCLKKCAVQVTENKFYSQIMSFSLIRNCRSRVWCALAPS